MKSISQKLFFLVFSLFIGISLSMQAAPTKKNLLINEIMVKNTANLVDDFGNRSAWIEIFNPTHRTIDIGGYYLTNDSLNNTKYKIPEGDEITQIKPLSHVVFYADDKTQYGTFHLNFTLEESNYIALYDIDGITRLDYLLFPEDLVPDYSFGRLVDGEKEWGILPKITPYNNNSIVDKTEVSKTFAENDPFGAVLALASMSVVFLSLILLYALFSLTAKVSLSITKDRMRKTSKIETIEEHVPGEVYASIAMALHEYQQEIHDVEETILTIQRVAKTYSPWSSKIYGLRYNPFK